MPVLWAGQEDIDFPNGAQINIDQLGSRFRAGYARYSLSTSPANGISRSTVFSGGPITSAWITARIASNSAQTSMMAFGLVNDASANGSGLWISCSTSSPTKLAVFKFDGTTKTQLAAEAGNSLAGDNVIQKVDMQVISYGASATLNVYYNGNLAFTFTGDVRVGSVTNLDSVAIQGYVGGVSVWRVSELIVSDEDTRQVIGLVTMAPTGAGTTDLWAGAFTDINEIFVSDSTMISTNTPDQDEQFNLIDMPAGNFAVKAVVVAVRAMSTSGATATKVALGFNSGGTVAVGTSQAAPASWVRLTQVFSQNPVTSANWAVGEMTALQLNLRSGT